MCVRIYVSHQCIGSTYLFTIYLLWMWIHDSLLLQGSSLITLCDYFGAHACLLMCMPAQSLKVPDSLWPHGLYLIRLLCPWDFLSNNTGGVAISSSREIFLTQGWNLNPQCSLHWQADSWSLCHLGSSSLCSCCLRFDQWELLKAGSSSFSFSTGSYAIVVNI